jgi:hypothetical protein
MEIMLSLHCGCTITPKKCARSKNHFLWVLKKFQCHFFALFIVVFVGFYTEIWYRLKTEISSIWQGKSKFISRACGFETKTWGTRTSGQQGRLKLLFDINYEARCFHFRQIKVFHFILQLIRFLMKLLYSNNGLTNKRPLMLQGPESCNPKRQCTTGVNMDSPGTSQQQQDSYNMRVSSLSFGICIFEWSK